MFAGLSAWRIGAWAAAGAGVLVLFLMWKAEHARAAMLEVSANVAQTQLDAATKRAATLARQNQAFERDLAERSTKLRNIRNQTDALRHDLRAAREKGSEAYRQCMDIRVPDAYRKRLRAYLHGSTAGASPGVPPPPE